MKARAEVVVMSRRGRTVLVRFFHEVKPESVLDFAKKKLSKSTSSMTIEYCGYKWAW